MNGSEKVDSTDLLRNLGITGYSLTVSVKVNSLWVRPKALQSHLGRYAHRFVKYTGDEVYQFQHIGTATGIKYRGRYFVISTYHQHEVGEKEGLGIYVFPENCVVIPGKKWIFNGPLVEGRDDCYDFVIYEYQLQNHNISHFPSKFFAVDENNSIGDFDTDLSLMVGYPTRLQNIDYYEGDINLLLVSSSVRRQNETTEKDVWVFETQNSEHFFEDGTSGSPIFQIVRHEDMFKVNWLGLVIRGGEKSRFGRVIQAEFILEQIDKAVFKL